MNIRTFSTLLFASTFATNLPATDRAEIERSASLLASQSETQRKKGQKWLEENGEAAIRALTADLAEGGESYAVSAQLLRTLISPHARAEAANRAHKGHLNLYRPASSVTRPVDHPQAPEIRKAALATLEKILTAAEPQSIQGIRTLTQLLAEVADQPTIDALVAFLEKAESDDTIVHLVHAAQTAYGIIAYENWGGLCGNSSPEEIARFNAAQLAEAIRVRDLFLKYHETHRADTEENRLRSAIGEWSPILSKYTGNHATDWLPQSYTPLIRLGSDAVPALRREQAKTKSILGRGAFETVIVAITGEEDKDLVKTLLAGKNSSEKILALEIINTAGSTAWKEQLVALQDPKSEVALKASHVLANIHRADALPHLKAAANNDESNYIAKCAADEILAWGK